MLWQGVSIGCSAATTMVHAGIAARARRELTPLEAVNDSARCTLLPAMFISLYAQVTGMKDNACTRAVARRAFRENNSPRAREELFWRDGSWERRQQKFLDAYATCYRKNAKRSRAMHKRRR